MFAWAVLHGGLAALCLVSQLSRFGRAALFCVAWVCADASVIRSCSTGGLALPYPRPSSLHFRDVQVRFSAPGHWPCSSWRGRDGSICRGDRVICQLHQLGPPLCGPPHRRPSPRAPRSGLAGGKSFLGYFLIIYILLLNITITIKLLEYRSNNRKLRKLQT